MLWNVVAGSDTITMAGTMPSAKAPKTMLIRYRTPAIRASWRGEAPSTKSISDRLVGASGVSVVFIIASFRRGDGGKNREATLGVSAGEEEAGDEERDGSIGGKHGESGPGGERVGLLRNAEDGSS